MAQFYGYEKRKWWWFVMYLNLAAAKYSDPEGYNTLIDIIELISTAGEDAMLLNSLNSIRSTHGTAT